MVTNGSHRDRNTERCRGRLPLILPHLGTSSEGNGIQFVCDREGNGDLMDLTATRKHFQTSRTATSISPRTWLERLADGSWTDKVREGSHALIDALPASLRSPRRLEAEHRRKAMDHRSTVYGRFASLVLKAHDRCAPTLSKIHDLCAPTLARVARGAREISYRATTSRELTRIIIVVALPALSFACFALARWAADGDPAATALTSTASAANLADGGGAYAPREPHMRISTTLVEPPTLDAMAFRGNATVQRPQADLVPPDVPSVILTNVPSVILPNVPSAASAAILPPPDERQAVEATDPVQGTALTATQPETPSGATTRDDPPAAAYPFTPRPRPVR